VNDIAAADMSPLELRRLLPEYFARIGRFVTQRPARVGAP
jgi:hypothetical protein